MVRILASDGVALPPFVWTGGVWTLENEGQKKTETADPETEEGRGDKGREENRLFCSICHYPITGKEQRMEVNGSHEHTFANPGGYIHRIGCFAAAPGCITGPHETAEFTWFAGYVWSISGCAMCGNHVGWRFRGARLTFYGLVLDRLVEKDRIAD